MEILAIANFANNTSCACFVNCIIFFIDILAIVNVTTNSLCEHLCKCQLYIINMLYKFSVSQMLQLIHFQMFGQSLIHH